MEKLRASEKLTLSRQLAKLVANSDTYHSCQKTSCDFRNMFLGGTTKSPLESGSFWGVPGSSIPKSSTKKKKVISAKTQQRAPPKKKEPEPFVAPISFDKPKKERVYVTPTYTECEFEHFLKKKPKIFKQKKMF